jgi:glucan 1,3-beta-glucosidase
VASFPEKEVLLGEFGWPSAGRMREGALPSPVNQARTMHEVVAQAMAQKYRVNLIEAYDQPWKRQLEGTVGGHWGLFDANRRSAKFAWGGRVSDHPQWPWQAAGGVAIAAAIFAAAFLASRGRAGATGGGLWLPIATIALVSGSLIGWTAENVAIESLGIGGGLNSLGCAMAALLLPIFAAHACAKGQTLPSFAQIVGRKMDGRRGALPATPQLAAGMLLVLLALLAVAAALGLVFDPRYRDFPFTPLTGAAVPLLFLARWRLRPKAPAAELVMAATLVLAAIYVIANEGLANWQACWCGAALILLAFTLLRAQDAPNSA